MFCFDFVWRRRIWFWWATPTPTPSTPAPAPSPTPQPSPTPTPSPTYDVAIDFSRDLSSTALGVELLNYDDRFALGEPSFSPNDGLTYIAYVAGDRRLLATYEGENSEFVASEIDINNPDVLQYNKVQSGGYDVFLLARPSPDIVYTGIARQSIRRDLPPNDTAPDRENIERYYLLGSETLVTDMPRSGSTTYAALIGSSRVSDGGVGFFAQDARINIDHTSGKVEAVIDAMQSGWLAGSVQETATLHFSGNVSTQGVAISGTITSPDGRYTGQFIGRLFGPRGVEVGLLLILRRYDGARIIGYITGYRTGV